MSRRPPGAVEADLDGPVLDLAAPDEYGLAADLDRAFRDEGFAVLTGHGLSGELARELRRALLSFFHLPVARKRRYAPVRTGDFGWIDRSDVGGAGRPELCEVFAAGPWGEPGAPTDGMSAAAIAMTVGSNKWPDGLPGLRALWLDHYDAVERTADVLLRLAALALGERDDAFSRHHRNPLSPMIANWYPAQPRPAGRGALRKGAHSDWGSLTLLWLDGTPGLEVRGADGGWRPVNPPEGGLLVLVGDLMARWTNDRWRATGHRVVNPVGDFVDRERLSIAWFGQPDYDSVIRPLPSCIPPAGPRDYPPIVCGDWYSAKLRGAYGP